MSNKITISVGETPLILIESIKEDLRIRGQDTNEVVISHDGESLDYEIQSSAANNQTDASQEHTSEAESADGPKAEEAGSSVVLGKIVGDCTLDVPMGASVRIGKIGGDAQLRSVFGHIEIKSVGEDLSATKIGSIQVESIGADALLKRVDGSVSIDNVGSDASCNDIKGDLAISVGEDLSLAAIHGNLNAKVGADAILRFPLNAESQYNVIASGDIACYLPQDTNADIMLRSGTRTLRVRGWEVPEPPEDELYTFTLGEGGASLNLNAGEDIALINQESQSGPGIDFDFDFDFGPGFKFHFDSDSGFRPEQFSNLFSEKIQSKVQNAMRQAEESIANAIAQAESRIANAEQRASDFEAKWTGHRPRGPKSRWRENPIRDRRRREDRQRDRQKNRHSNAPINPSSNEEKAPITEAERLMVLRMVEEGKISVEQAEKLLSAMGS